MNRQDEAVAGYDQAIALKPDYAEAHNFRGVALCDLNRHHEAIASHDRAISLRSNYAEAHSGRGIALGQLGQLEEAIESFERAISIRPDYTEAHRNLAMIFLQSGLFERGWENYEWRFKTGNYKSTPLSAYLPHWRTGDNAKRLLIWAEQGVGNEILFAGLLSETSRLSSHVWAMVDSRLIPLFARSMPSIQFLPYNLKITEEIFDTQIPMGRLGRYLRNWVSPSFPRAWTLCWWDGRRKASGGGS